MELCYNDGGKWKHKALFKQRNDCSVKAVAIACEISYLESYKVFKRNRRRDDQGATSFVINKTIKDVCARTVKKQKSFYYEYVDEMTLEVFCYSHPYGYYILELDEHVCAIINGVCHDVLDQKRLLGQPVLGVWMILKD